MADATFFVAAVLFDAGDEKPSHAQQKVDCVATKRGLTHRDEVLSRAAGVPKLQLV